MLLKFSSADMLNTTLLDIATGQCAYHIVTIPISAPVLPEEQTSLSDIASSSNPRSPTVVGSSPSFLKKRSPSFSSDTFQSVEDRRTTITGATGTTLAEVSWKGRRPTISIDGEKVGALTDLFGSTTVRFMPKILAIPTRFDTEYVWTATADSLTLFDYDTETVKGSFHQNVVRLPMVTKGSKFKLLSSKKSRISSKSTDPLSPPLSPSLTEDLEPDEETSKSTFIATGVPGLGSNYLEFTSHPLAHDVEIILSFLMMEILRRGRFSLTLYTFEKPKLWQFQEARDLFMRRIRRNTL
ncbi:hypothetical protein CVT25_015256 [Psilocybe cyanescens]|uniref:Uncharacterized protein n=1 Tax=Psilocybe cyanescens TaxID=93625 RepID=A0A409XRB3_PSICY|nr:hypothetical protein CVT25_015256 [Psilocybe cyanescens]